jgi:hypothetical protein
MNIDERFDIISANVIFYTLYIPFNVLAIILALPCLLFFIPFTYFRNYNEFTMIISFPNILILYYIFYKIIFESMLKLIK